jgi:HpiC1 cyclase
MSPHNGPRTIGLWIGIAVTIVLGARAPAAPPAIANAGFEDLYLGSNLPPQYGGDVPTGAFPTGPAPSGWSAWYAGGSALPGMYVGVLNPGTTADHAPNPPCFPAGAPEGDNVVLVYMDGDAGSAEYGVEQTLGDTLDAETLYTLEVEVGNIASCAGLVAPYQSLFDLRGFPGYRIQVRAGGVLLAENTNTLTLADGEFATATLAFATDAAPAQLGQALVVRLINRNQPGVAGVDGLEVDFDDVRLDATPLPESPMPHAVVLPVSAVLLMGLARRHSRRDRLALSL